MNAATERRQGKRVQIKQETGKGGRANSTDEQGDCKRMRYTYLRATHPAQQARNLLYSSLLARKRRQYSMAGGGGLTGGPAFVWPSNGSPAETFSVTVRDPRATSRSTLHLQDICQQNLNIVQKDGATIYAPANASAGNCM